MTFNNQRYLSLALLAATLLCTCGQAAEIGSDIEFVPASTVEQVREQIEKLPDDDIWWTVNGKDMAWNFKNLHRIFPTVNV